MPEGAEKPDLLSMLPEAAEGALAAHFSAHGERPFRVRQTLAWLYQRDALSFTEMTDLPGDARSRLARSFTLSVPAVARVERSVDGTAKHLWRMSDGELVESVLIPSHGRLTLCIS